MNVSRLETVFRDYAPQGVKFYYVYKALAHPEYMSYVNPFTLEERLMHVAEAKRTLGMEIPWIVDNMENTLKEVLSKRFSNAEMIIDAQGVVIGKRAWSRPEEIREALTRWVGPVGNPTQMEDLNLKTAPPPKAAASGVVPPIDRPDPAQMRPPWVVYGLVLVGQSQAQFGTVPTVPRDERKIADNAEFREVSPRIGESLPDLAGFDEQGNAFSLDQLKGHLTVLVFGCLT